MCLGEPSETVSGVSTSPSVSELPRMNAREEPAAGSREAWLLLLCLLPCFLSLCDLGPSYP